ncbi:MAG: peptidase [Anaerocolumna sp.]|jgi:hypothetical protein|nr:peptidase [Anaerocolumna sp.]
MYKGYKGFIIFALIISMVPSIIDVNKNSSVANIKPISNKEIKKIVSEYKTDPRKPNNDTKYIINKKIPKLLSQYINQKRQMTYNSDFFENIEKFEAFYYSRFDKKEDDRIAKIVASLPDAVMAEMVPEFLKPQKAEEEIKFLFDYLKYGYASYQYFGGDEVFIPVRDKLIRLLPSVTDKDNRIPLDSYIKLMVEYLKPVVVDCHFSIGDINFAGFNSYRYYYYTESIIFHKDKKGFYASNGDNKYYLKTVNGEIPNNYIKPTIAPDGSFGYIIGLTSKTKIIDMSVQIILGRGNDYTVENLTLKAAKKNYLKESDLETGYRKFKEKGVTVIENRRLYSVSNTDTELNKFISDSSSFKNDKSLILDIRHNTGGEDSYAFNWMSGYTGEWVNPYSIFSGGLHTKTVFESQKSFNNLDYDSYEKEAQIPGWYDTGYAALDMPYRNKNLLFALTDPWVASSGETFLALLKETQNTIIVGINSCGMRLSSNNREIYLPHSKISIYCGENLNLPSNLFWTDGVGYEPDLWVEPSLSKERLIKFIKYYGLNK